MSLLDKHLPKIEEILAMYKEGAEIEVSFLDANREKSIKLLKTLKTIAIRDKLKIVVSEELDINLTIRSAENNNVYKKNKKNKPEPIPTYRLSVVNSDDVWEGNTKISNNDPIDQNDMIQHVIMSYRDMPTFEFFRTLLKMVQMKKVDNVNLLKKMRFPHLNLDISDLNLRMRYAEESTPDWDDAILKNLVDERTIFTNEQISIFKNNITFRHKKRFRCYKKDNMAIDITEVISSQSLFDLGKKNPSFEIELELLPNYKREGLLNTIVFLTKCLQQSQHIITKDISDRVLETYNQLFFGTATSKTTTLYGKQPISLEIDRLLSDLPGKYSVTDKADGERYFLIIYDKRAFLISNNLHVKATGVTLKSKDYDGSVFDGEYIFLHKKNKFVFLIFDCLFYKTNDIRLEPLLMKRLAKADDIISECFVASTHKYSPKDVDTDVGKFSLENNCLAFNKKLETYYTHFNHDVDVSKELLIRRKFFIDVKGAMKEEIYSYAEVFWNKYIESKLWPYELDGLIFTCLNQPYSRENNTFPELKWKPENSIDFYVDFVRDDQTNQVLNVYDNSDKFTNYGDEGNKDEEVVAGEIYRIAVLQLGMTVNKTEKPEPFLSNEGTPFAHFYLQNGEVRDAYGDVVPDRCVIECAYENNLNIAPEKRWNILRIRNDKTERVHNHKRGYGNYMTIGQKTWDCIINPVTIADLAELGKPERHDKKMQELAKKISQERLAARIFGGSQDDEKSYYSSAVKRKDITTITLNNFHNYIKSSIIYTYGSHKLYQPRRLSVWDNSFGRGGDIMKYYYIECSKLVGTDVNGSGLHGPIDSAQGRLDKFSKGKAAFFSTVLIQADATLPMTPEDQTRVLSLSQNDIIAIKETFPPNDPPKFDILSTQFAFHYFLKSKSSFEGIKANINKHLAPGGVLLLTLFDGDSIYNLLKGKDKHTEMYVDKKTGESKIFFEISKNYSDDDKSYIGKQIEFYGYWMFSESVSEYLVHYEFLVEELDRDCDLDLLESDMFGNFYEYNHKFFKQYWEYNQTDTKGLYEKVASLYNNDPDGLNEKIKKFSFLNRFYVFKKRPILNGPKKKTFVKNTTTKQKMPNPQKFTGGNVQVISDGHSDQNKSNNSNEEHHSFKNKNNAKFLEEFAVLEPLSNRSGKMSLIRAIYQGISHGNFSGNGKIYKEFLNLIKQSNVLSKSGALFDKTLVKTEFKNLKTVTEKTHIHFINKNNSPDSTEGINLVIVIEDCNGYGIVVIENGESLPYIIVKEQCDSSPDFSETTRYVCLSKNNKTSWYRHDAVIENVYHYKDVLIKKNSDILNIKNTTTNSM